MRLPKILVLIIPRGRDIWSPGLGGSSQDFSQYSGGPRLPTLRGVPPGCNQTDAALAAISNFASATGVNLGF